MIKIIKNMLENIKIKGPYKLEKDFTTDFLKEFKKDGWSFKIPDIIRTIKPFDFFGINKDGVFFCEVKIIENTTFNIYDLRNNQLTSLEKIHLLTEKYSLKNIFPIVLVYSKSENDYYIIHIKEVLKILNSGGKSIILK